MMYFSVPLSDPACFAPVVKYVKSIAEKMNQDAVVNNYVVLLIITDGGITGKTDKSDTDSLQIGDHILPKAQVAANKSVHSF